MPERHLTMEIETVTIRGLTVEVRSDALWFTVYDRNGTIAGTMQRPGQFSRGWRSYLRSGEGCRVAVGPRTALRNLAARIEEVQA